MSTWKGRERKPYPAHVFRQPWVVRKCVVCGVQTSTAVPISMKGGEVMCFECPTQPDELANLKEES